jgi:hypothetical protein
VHKLLNATLLSVSQEFDYEVALSFAGEDRTKVRPIADLLKSRGVSVFYDNFEQARLWGKDLAQHLSELYFRKARFFVPFLSQDYARKAWPNHELKSALARALNENQEYILPIRIDDTEIPGVLPTVSYIDYHGFTTEQIADLILAKLDHSAHSSVTLSHKGSTTLAANVFIPKIQKTFTQREKDKFARDSFEGVMSYFEDALQQLEGSDPDIETTFEAIHRLKFICTVYVKGEVANRCKIWLGRGWSRSETINFTAGKDVDPNDDNSFGETIDITDDSHQLVLHLSGVNAHRMQADEKLVTGDKASEYLWKRFMEPIDSRR